MQKKQNRSLHASALQITKGMHAAGKLRTARSNNPHSIMKPRILFLFTLLCAAITSLQSIHAATLAVTNTNDSGSGTLRQAILDANANAGTDTITFEAGLTGAIQLESALPALADNVTITGPGPNVLTVKRDPAAAQFRIFIINSGVTATISGLTMSGGDIVINGGFFDFSCLRIK